MKSRTSFLQIVLFGLIAVSNVLMIVPPLKLTAHSRQITGISAVSWSPDGSKIAAGNVDGTIKIWDSGTNQLLLALQGSTGRVEALAWNAAGNRLASANDAEVRVWDTLNGRLVFTFQGHESKVFAVAWSPDGGKLISGSVREFTGNLRVWNPTTGRLLANHQVGSIVQIAWNSANNQISLANPGGSVQILSF